MAETTTTSTQAEPEHPTEQRGQQRFLVWHRLALGGIFLIAVFMNFYRLGQNGFDSYYPPAVRSMMDNWHNFFFAAYDPGGFTALDKPPVGFWFQVASAKLFGFTPFSVLLPQALSGVLSGFSSYPLTTTELTSLVAKGTVRFFLLSKGGNIPPQFHSEQGQGVQVVIGGPGNGQPSAITTWVTKHCKAVPASQWQSSSSSSAAGSGPGGASQFYDCATAH